MFSVSNIFNISKQIRKDGKCVKNKYFVTVAEKKLHPRT